MTDTLETEETAEAHGCWTDTLETVDTEANGCWTDTLETGETQEKPMVAERILGKQRRHSRSQWLLNGYSGNRGDTAEANSYWKDTLETEEIHKWYRRSPGLLKLTKQ